MHVVVRGRRRLQGEKYLCGRACHVSKYSIGLAREGIDLAIDRSIRRSRIRCCRRPGLDLLVVQHRVDHTRCVASLTFSPSLLRCLCSWLAPFSSFSPFSSSPFSSSPLIHRSTLTSILLSPIVALFPAFRSLPSSIVSPFSSGSTVVHARVLLERWKVKKAQAEIEEGRIKRCILRASDLNLQNLFFFAVSFEAREEELRGAASVTLFALRLRFFPNFVYTSSGEVDVGSCKRNRVVWSNFRAVILF